ncbi:hypothetical protein JCM11251_007752 [Rhodosporidiobolus azoricus]
MVNAPETTCAACRKTASAPAGESTRMLVCSRCQAKGKRQVYYCNRECQIAHFPTHKPFCGIPTPTAAAFDSISLDPSCTFRPPPALLYHLAALSQLPPPAFPDATPPPSFLYFPSSPIAPAEGSSSAMTDPPMPVPISLPEPSRNLFNALQFTAFKTGNPLAVNLMYSLLLTEIEALGGVEERLVTQLSEEFRLEGEAGRPTLRKMLEEEEEPSGEELMEAIGGAENMGMLLEWQMSEADRLR